MNLPDLGEDPEYVFAQNAGCCPALLCLLYARASKGGRVRDIAMSWRPSRRLSTRAMWALWLVCLVLTPGALVLQYVTGRQVDGVSWIRAGALIVFLWLTLAWLWPVRAQRKPRPRAHPGARRSSPTSSPRSSSASAWLEAVAHRRSRRGAGRRHARLLPVAHRRRQPHPAPPERHRVAVPGERRRRARRAADRAGSRHLADQRRLRHLRLGRAQHRLHVRRQRLRDAARPAPTAQRGDPDPALRRLRAAAGHRPSRSASCSPSTTCR